MTFSKITIGDCKEKLLLTAAKAMRQIRAKFFISDLVLLKLLSPYLYQVDRCLGIFWEKA